MLDTVRVFTGIEIPIEFKKKLFSIGNEFKNSKNRISWVKKENIHLTLEFIGNVEQNKIDDICKILKETVDKHSFFEIAIKGLGVFQKGRIPKVLWCGVEQGREELIEIYNEIASGLKPIIDLKEENKFSPHFTIARIKSIKDIETFNRVLLKNKDILIGKIPACDISLIKSILSSKGSIYETLYKAELKK